MISFLVRSPGLNTHVISSAHFFGSNYPLHIRIPYVDKRMQPLYSRVCRPRPDFLGRGRFLSLIPCGLIDCVVSHVAYLSESAGFGFLSSLQLSMSEGVDTRLAAAPRSPIPTARAKQESFGVPTRETGSSRGEAGKTRLLF